MRARIGLAGQAAALDDHLTGRENLELVGRLYGLSRGQARQRAGALRGLVLGQGALPPGRTVAGQVLLALAWAAAIGAVFAPLAVRAYRRSVR